MSTWAAVAIAVEHTRTEDAPKYRRALFPIAAGIAFLAFLAAPWPLAEKAHAFLHGLCAQRPSHTFVLGGQPLPFDARMTGIYAGFLCSAVFMVARGRHRRAGAPSRAVALVGVLLVAAMGIDGFNSLFLDLALPHLYQPSNLLRLATGAGVGLVLSCALCYLIANSVWRRPDRKRACLGAKDLLAVVGSLAPVGLFVTGWGNAYVPLTLALLFSAVAVFAVMALVSLVLIRRLDNSFDTVADVQPEATAALAIALVAIALLAAARFLFERHFGPSPLV